jgi:iron complex transport system substrate-binding protein
MKTLLTIALLLLQSAGMIASQRIVSIGGICTETLYALGKGSSVVAVDATSTHPSAVTSLPNLGYFGRIDAEAVLALKPTHVAMIAEADARGLSARLRAAGIRVVVVAMPDTPDQTAEAIRSIGTFVGEGAAAASLATKTLADVKKVEPFASSPAVLSLYIRGTKTLLVNGTDTGVDGLLRRINARNVASVKGALPLTAEAVVAMKPDYIVVTKNGVASVGGVDGVLSLPGIAATPAGKARRIVVLDDALLLTMGPRLGEAVQELRASLLKAGAR